MATLDPRSIVNAPPPGLRRRRPSLDAFRISTALGLVIVCGLVWFEVVCALASTLSHWVHL